MRPRSSMGKVARICTMSSVGRSLNLVAEIALDAKDGGVARVEVARDTGGTRRSRANGMMIRNHTCTGSKVIRGQSEANQRPSEAIRGHQRPSEANQRPIRGQSEANQRPSEAIRGHQRPSEVIRGHQRPIRGQSEANQSQSEPIRGHQRSSEAIRGYQRLSEAIRGHQRSSEAIRGHQRSSEVIRGFLSTPRPTAADRASHYAMRGTAPA